MRVSQSADWISEVERVSDETRRNVLGAELLTGEVDLTAFSDEHPTNTIKTIATMYLSFKILPRYVVEKFDNR